MKPLPRLRSRPSRDRVRGRVADDDASRTKIFTNNQATRASELTAAPTSLARIRGPMDQDNITPTGTEKTERARIAAVPQRRKPRLEQFLGRIGITKRWSATSRPPCRRRCRGVSEHGTRVPQGRRDKIKDGSNKATQFSKDNPGKSRRCGRPCRRSGPPLNA